MRISMSQMSSTTAGAPELDMTDSMTITNIDDGETVHQRCLLLKGHLGTCNSDHGEFLKVTVTDVFGTVSAPATWPIAAGRFKVLIMLSSGRNSVTLQHYRKAEIVESSTLDLNYVPLLQTPPLYLAIMVAKDSPLVIDCPDYKGAGLSSTHSSLDAAVAKFRTTALMWQAMTAEDMRMKGLGRRSFRLEEEYGVDTTSRASFQARGTEKQSRLMAPTPKVHLIKSKKTIQELLHSDVAQQNECAFQRDHLHKYFEQALAAHGGVFDSGFRPVVAGMILDSHYSIELSLVLGHAALGCHNENGLSLGMFGSHLTYSWPRFLEEVSDCLTDTTPPGDNLCNDNKECGTCWEACSIGQGAFLHEVGHAFGARHTTGIMARGYAQDWPKNFLSETAYCAHTRKSGGPVTDATPNGACWDYKDALAFRCLPQFRLPGDRTYTAQDIRAVPTVQAKTDVDGLEYLTIACRAGLARVEFRNHDLTETFDDDTASRTYEMTKFDKGRPLSIVVLGANGKERRIANAWSLLSGSSFIRVPNSDIILQKRSVSGRTPNGEDETTTNDDTSLQWAVMLREKGPNGTLSRANMIDLRVGGIMDGAVVHFEDGHKTPCGPRYRPNGTEHTFGGGASEQLQLPVGSEVKRVELSRSGGWGNGELDGIRVTLSTGESAGELNIRSDSGSVSGDEEDNEEDDIPREEEQNDYIETLEPGEAQRVVGFYGQSVRCSGYCREFGIITAPRGIELPPQVYDMVELQNTQTRLGL